MDRPYLGTITEDFSANNAGMVEMPKQDEVPKKGYGHGKSRKSALGTGKQVLYFSLNTAVLQKTAVFFYSTKYRITLLKITIYEKPIDQLSAVDENRLRFSFVAKSRYMTFYRQRAPPPYQLFNFKK